MVEMLFASEVERLRYFGGSHDVPTRSAPTQMVEGGEFTRHVIWLVVARGCRCHETDMAAQGGQCGQKRQRLKPHDVLRPALQRVEVARPHGHGVLQEQ